ncbi:MAG: hypothetical protein WCG34_09735, partial [Leptolinea sp.]
MNILSEMTIAAISPPSTRSEVQKTGDGDRSFQGELDVKMKVTQETQKQNAEKEKGTDVLAGAGAVTPQSKPVVILSEILKLAAQAASSQPNMATINA